VLVASVLAVVVALVAAWWWLARDANGPTRALEASNSESARVHDVELAASPASSAARAEAPDRAAIEVVALEPASPTVVSEPHLLVTRAKEPLVGARVELWNEPKEGDVESFEFTSDADGRVPLPAGLEARGPWFALAGGDGACSERLDPVLVDSSSGSTVIECVEMEHVAVLFERSDGLPIGTWPGVHCWFEIRRKGHVRWLRRGGVSEEQRNCLIAAGLDPATARMETDFVVLTWGGDPTAAVTGTFREPDTEWSAWSAGAVRLAHGGALVRVPLTVFEHAASGLVDVRFTGVEPTNVLANVGHVSIRLRPRGESGPAEVLRLWVRHGNTPMSRAQTQFRVPPGRYSAGLDLDHLTHDLFILPVPDFVVEEGGTTGIEFELPPLGLIVPDEVSLDRLEREGRSVGLRTIDALTRSEGSYDTLFGLERGAVVDPSRGIVRVLWPEPGFLVPRGTAAQLLEDPVAHAELLQSLEYVRRDTEPPPLPTSSSPWFVEVLPGSRAHVEFVPDPKREEER
jgi:hypothetical protein